MAFKIFSKFCFLAALLVIKKIDKPPNGYGNAQDTSYKTIYSDQFKGFLQIFVYSGVCSRNGYDNKKERMGQKRASFSAPSQIYLVIKLEVDRRLTLYCLGFTLNLSRHKAVYVKRTKDEAPHPKDKDRRL